MKRDIGLVTYIAYDVGLVRFSMWYVGFVVCYM